MVAYEYMAVVLSTFVAEFAYEVRLVWPHIGSGFGKFHRPIVLTLLSTTLGIAHALMEMVADFPLNRILGEAGRPETVYNSTLVANTTM